MIPMCRQDPSRLFHEGLRQFNAGEWFEAHETWEALWHTLEGKDRQFVQGLIQCAVVLEHVRRGNPRGALTMLDRASPRLAKFGVLYHGVPVRALVDALEAFVAPLREMDAASLAPRAGRGLALPVDIKEAPTIVLRGEPQLGTGGPIN